MVTFQLYLVLESATLVCILSDQRRSLIRILINI